MAGEAGWPKVDGKRFAMAAPRIVDVEDPASKRRMSLAITVFIRYQIDPFQKVAFEEYARRWLTIIPKCGGEVVGYWMPSEGTNNIAFGLISFESLAAYETYRATLRSDQDGMANFAFAEERRLILGEERTFLRPVAASSTDTAM